MTSRILPVSECLIRYLHNSVNSEDGQYYVVFICYFRYSKTEWLQRTDWAFTMNCLGHNRRSINHETFEPSAPSYYPPQLPYNPSYIEPQVISVSDDLGLVYGWGALDHDFDAQNTFDKYECYGWGWRRRRSLYEGVNLMPVVSEFASSQRRTYVYRCVLFNKY